MNQSNLIELLLFLVLTYGLIIKKPFYHLASPLFVLSILYLYIYFFQSYLLKEIFYKLGFIDTEYYNIFLVYILLTYIFFYIGYNLCDYFINNANNNSLKINFSWKRLEIFGILFGIIGFLLYFYFLIKSGITVVYSGHGKGDFKVGGYIYEMRYWIFSSLAVLLNVRLYSGLSLKGRFFYYFFLIFLIIDAILRQQRGSFIRLFAIFNVSYVVYYYVNYVSYRNLTLAKFLLKNIKIALTLLLLLLLIPTMILVRYYGTSIVSIEGFVSLIKILINKPYLLFVGSGISPGSELVTAYNAFLAAIKSGRLDYGLKWIEPFLNFIPRNLWPNKPYWDSFSISIFEMIDRYGLIFHAPGSAETGAIDSFYRFSWGALIFYFILGFFSKRFFLKALSGNIDYVLYYIAYLVGFMYFILQNMFPFVVFSIYMLVPIVLAIYFSKRIYK